MAKAFRSSPIALSKQIEIAKFAAANPHMQLTDVVEHYGGKYTYNQIVRIAAKHKAGKLTVKSAPKSKAKKLQDLMSENTAESIFDKQIHFALSQLEADTTAPAIERVAALYKLQQMMLSSHMKRADAVVFKSLVRRFLPEATDSEILKILEEELEKCKTSRA